MKTYVKILVLVVAAVVAISVGVYAYFLMLPRVSLLVYPDSQVTGCKQQLNETVILHVKNDGTVELHVNATAIYIPAGITVTYLFQTDIVIPVGVEAVISFPAGGGEVTVKTISGPPGAAASGGVYAVSDNPDPNPFVMTRAYLWIYTREGQIGGKRAIRIALVE